MLENVCEQLSPAPFLVFWDKVSLLCLGGLRTRYAVNSNWLWTWDLLLRLLSDKVISKHSTMTLWGNVFYTAWGIHQTASERLLLGIIIQIPRRIHRAFFSCGIFSIQYFCAVQKSQTLWLLFGYLFPSVDKNPQSADCPIHFCTPSIWHNVYLKYTVAIVTFVWPMGLAWQPELNVWWFINNSIIITSISEKQNANIQKDWPTDLWSWCL